VFRTEENRHGNSFVFSLIRKALDQFLLNQKPDRAALYRQALTVVGKYDAGIRNVSLEHDRYIEDEEEYRS
jgi:hypothetical protein